jgi:protease IV
VTRRLVVLGLTLALWAGLLGLFLVVVASALRVGEGGAVAFGPRVAVVELEGIILDVEDLLRDLRSHRDNPVVRAVVVRINSPGGVVGPTQEVHDALQRMREAGKPVVASLGAVAASGGYYVAVAADRIYANPGTLTGSIGVIIQMANVESLMKKVGVDYVVIKAGHFKDMGNVSRRMTAEERRVLQALLDDVHAQFIQAVSAGRRLDDATVRRFADGRVFSGVQAKALGMLDELGGLEEAIDAAAQMAGLDVPPRVIQPRRRFSVFDLLRNEWGLGVRAVLRPALPVFKTPLYLMD